MTKAAVVKGEPGIRAYRWAVEEELFGNYDISERTMRLICRKRASNIRIRHRRGTPPRETAEVLAEWHKLKPLKRIRQT